MWLKIEETAMGKIPVYWILASPGWSIYLRLFGYEERERPMLPAGLTFWL